MIEGTSKPEVILGPKCSLLGSQSDELQREYHCRLVARGPRNSRKAKLPEGARELVISGDLRRYSDCRTAALKLIQENKESGIAENSPEIKSADRAKQQQGKENRKKAKMSWQVQRWEAWPESTPQCEA